MEIKNKSVLIVDDMDAIRKITSDQLRRIGVSNVYQADNGVKALHILDKTTIDLIISDWNMPMMNGLELLAKIKQMPALAHIPFFMITSESSRDKISIAINQGVTDLIIKPFTTKTLKDRVLSALLGDVKNKFISPSDEPIHDKHTTARFDPSQPVVEEKPTILVVDDTVENLTLIAGLLKNDYRIKLAKDGLRALALCQSETPPDLVLLDVMMPGMDGFEVLDTLRKNPDTANIPVIFVTALKEDNYQIKGLESGAVDYISKPIQPELLKLRVKNLITHVQIHKNLQREFDALVQNEKLKAEVQQIFQHDVKGPLAAILNLAEQIKKDLQVVRADVDNISLVEDMAIQLLNMVNMSSELYKIETGTFALHATAFSIDNLLCQIIEVLKNTFQVKNLFIYLERNEDADEQYSVKGDYALSYSLFFNLLTNACEAAPDKSRVSIKINKETMLNVQIENVGVVPLSIRERFWEKYVTSGKSHGTGIGTYSAKLLAEAQKGKVALQIDDTSSTTLITVSLPY